MCLLVALLLVVQVEIEPIADVPGGLAFHPSRHELRDVTLSPDRRTIAYVASRLIPNAHGFVHPHSVLIRNNRVSLPYSDVRDVLFSPDGRLCYRFKDDGRTTVVVGDRRFGPYSWAGEVKWSGDGSTFAFPVTVGRSDHLIVNGATVAEGSPDIAWNTSDNFEISFDGSRIVAGGNEVDRKSCIIDRGRPAPGPAEFYNPVISPKGNRLAYQIGSDPLCRVAVDGKAGDAFEWISPIVWSPDGLRVAYIGKLPGKKKWVVVQGTRRGPELAGVGALVFSPDGTRLVYAGTRDERRWTVFGSDLEGREYTYVGTPVFSPDGSKLVYPVREGERTRMEGWPVVDRENQPLCDQTVFSGEGKALAHTYSGVGGVAVGVGRRTSPTYESIQGLAWMAAEKRFVFIGLRDNRFFRVAIAPE
jgi:WD40 repeat protein